MGVTYETIVCRGCGTRISIRELEWSGDRTAYSQNAHFNADVPCEACKETYSYGPKDIQLVESASGSKS